MSKIETERKTKMRDIGRIDWMTKKKVWRVIRYSGQRDIKDRDFANREDAVRRMREIVNEKL